MVHYFREDTNFNFKNKRFNSAWLNEVAHNEGKVLGDINIIFCSDPYLLEINRTYLKHDFYTDVITFDYCEGNILTGDIFISVDTVKDNASFYNVEFSTEMSRVIVHGLLHLIGYDDHTQEDQMVMREKENFYIDLRSKLNNE